MVTTASSLMLFSVAKIAFTGFVKHLEKWEKVKPDPIFLLERGEQDLIWGIGMQPTFTTHSMLLLAVLSTMAVLGPRNTGCVTGLWNHKRFPNSLSQKPFLHPRTHYGELSFEACNEVLGNSYSFPKKET